MNYNFVGTIASFVSLYKFIPNNLMDENDYSIQKIGVYFPPSLLKNTSKPILADSVLQILGANLISKEIVMKLHELRILKQSLLWSPDQIVWEEGTSSFLIGDVSIEANDVSIAELAAQLSHLKHEIFIYRGDNNDEYDFNLVYIDHTIMKDEMLNTFGIQLETKIGKVSRYNFEVIEYKQSTLDIE